MEHTEKERESEDGAGKKYQGDLENNPEVYAFTLWRPHFDGLIDASCRNDIDQLRCVRGLHCTIRFRL